MSTWASERHYIHHFHLLRSSPSSKIRSVGYVAFRKNVCAGKGDFFLRGCGAPTLRSPAHPPSFIFISARLLMDVL